MSTPGPEEIIARALRKLENDRGMEDYAATERAAAAIKALEDAGLLVLPAEQTSALVEVAAWMARQASEEDKQATPSTPRDPVGR